jgi:hypothetical protein
MSRRDHVRMWLCRRACHWRSCSAGPRRSYRSWNPARAPRLRRGSWCRTASACCAWRRSWWMRWGCSPPTRTRTTSPLRTCGSCSLPITWARSCRRSTQVRKVAGHLGSREAAPRLRRSVQPRLPGLSAAEGHHGMAATAARQPASASQFYRLTRPLRAGRAALCRAAGNPAARRGALGSAVEQYMAYLHRARQYDLLGTEAAAMLAQLEQGAGRASGRPDPALLRQNKIQKFKRWVPGPALGAAQAERERRSRCVCARVRGRRAGSPSLFRPCTTHHSAHWSISTEALHYLSIEYTALPRHLPAILSRESPCCHARCTSCALRRWLHFAPRFAVLRIKIVTHCRF